MTRMCREVKMNEQLFGIDQLTSRGSSWILKIAMGQAVEEIKLISTFSTLTSTSEDRGKGRRLNWIVPD